ncbi:hypothetical protein ApAK_07340 [Thermoplasmatales archaeon AK]|nr:hypothetical protein [Thermoplasmatales archaeon AK]
MERSELVELIKLPFFNYFYSNVFRDSEVYGSLVLRVPYRYMLVLIPNEEEFGILRIASSDKFRRVEVVAEATQVLTIARLNKSGYKAYICGGDPEEVILPDEFLKVYTFARDLWMSLERPSFDIQTGAGKIVFNLKTTGNNLLIFSTRSSTPERYGLSMNLLLVRFRHSSLDNYVSFYPRNFGKSPPKFYSVNCTAFRLNSNGELQEIPIVLAFEGEDFFGYKDMIKDELYFAKVALVAARSFGDITEPDYSIVLELLTVNPYLVAAYYGSAEENRAGFLVERVLRQPVESQLETLLGYNIFERGTELTEPTGVAEMEKFEGGIRLRAVKLNAISRFLYLYITKQNRSFCEGFLKSKQKIRFLAELDRAIEANSMYLPTGELMSRPLKSALDQIMRGGP